MQLSLYDLKQIDEPYLRSLSHETLLTLTFKAFSDLNECHDRLNQNSTNSSTPPSAEKPWTKIGLKQDALNNNSEEDPEDQPIDLDKEKDIEEKAAQDLNKQQLC